LDNFLSLDTEEELWSVCWLRSWLSPRDSDLICCSTPQQGKVGKLGRAERLFHEALLGTWIAYGLNPTFQGNRKKDSFSSMMGVMATLTGVSQTALRVCTLWFLVAKCASVWWVIIKDKYNLKTKHTCNTWHIVTIKSMLADSEL
jgi:hypothetical protein